MKRKINRPNMKIKTLLLWSVTLAALAFASCSGDDATGSDPTGPGTTGDQLQTVRLYLNVPSTATARVGDPGYPTGEGEDWDQLAVMIESAENPKKPITADGKSYYVRILSKNEYETLPLQSGYRWLPIDLVKGSSVYIYGVTYSQGVTGNPEQAIENVETNGGSFAHLEIPNNYSANESGQIDAAKFLSVATGYYTNDQGERTFTVTQPTGDLYDPATMPTMTLTRLAAKIDIQWDAQDAYPDYTDVKVTDFTFDNNTEQPDGTETNNNGALFPALHSVTNADGHTTFYNTTAISQRNGRVYHYAFPNGSTPEVRFTITSQSADNPTAASVTNTYTFKFKDKLQKATWYKLNVTIRGNSGNATISQEDESGILDVGN